MTRKSSRDRALINLLFLYREVVLISLGNSPIQLIEFSFRDSACFSKFLSTFREACTLGPTYYFYLIVLLHAATYVYHRASLRIIQSVTAGAGDNDWRFAATRTSQSGKKRKVRACIPFCDWFFLSFSLALNNGTNDIFPFSPIRFRAIRLNAALPMHKIHAPIYRSLLSDLSCHNCFDAILPHTFLTQLIIARKAIIHTQRSNLSRIGCVYDYGSDRSVATITFFGREHAARRPAEHEGVRQRSIFGGSK